MPRALEINLLGKLMQIILMTNELESEQATVENLDNKGIMALIEAWFSAGILANFSIGSFESISLTKKM